MYSGDFSSSFFAQNAASNQTSQFGQPRNLPDNAYNAHHLSLPSRTSSDGSLENQFRAGFPGLDGWGSDWEGVIEDVDWNFVLGNSGPMPPKQNTHGLECEQQQRHLSPHTLLTPTQNLPHPPTASSEKQPAQSTQHASLTFINEFPPSPPSPPPPSNPTPRIPSPKPSDPPPPTYLPCAVPRKPTLPLLSTTKTQGPREKTEKRKLTDAQKSARALSLAENKANREKFEKAVKSAYDDFMEELGRIAGEYKKDPEEAYELAWAQMRAKKTRNVSSHNALLHFVRKQENDGNPLGARKNLEELTELMQTNPEYVKLKKDLVKMQKLKDELEEERTVKKVGVQTNDSSITQDVRCTFDHIMQELMILHKRTKVRGFLFVTKGSEDCPLQPGWGTTDNSVQNFF
ncbi:hypothetical protein V5O48_017113 [Marasmius crinis-equi]|uniref:Uncharacterized protein n=1 Tax=Marasmius crinis-equi TaxID=585013 RepID=A0ABR3EPV8_9AGAR